MVLDTTKLIRVEGSTFVKQKHSVEVPVLCPRTHNPMTGSYLTIEYSPVDNIVIEIYSLNKYIQSFTDNMDVRDVEQLTMTVAVDCRKLLRTDVKVTGYFVINVGQTIETVAESKI